MADFPGRYRSFLKRIAAFARELPRLAEDDVAALHRARIASRRLREWVPLLELDPDTARTLNRRLRKVTKRLGEVRELDVLVLTIEALPRNRRYSRAALQPVKSDVLQGRTAAHERLASGRMPTKLKRLVHKLERAARHLESDGHRSRHPHGGGSPKAWVWGLEARLARRAATLRTAMDIAGALYVPGHLHAVRIAIKKLRYAAELSAEARGVSLGGDLTALKRAQDLLGHLHDLESLLEWQRKGRPGDLDPISARQRESLTRALEDDCRRLHAHYVRHRARLLATTERIGGSKSKIARVLGRATA
jgi:CHAD domain-containing protein